MSKSWRVISLVVLIAILLGAVCVGVGLVTGGEWDRIYSILDARYHIDMYVDYVGDVFTVLKEAWVAPPAAETPAPDVPEADDGSATVVTSEPVVTAAPAPEEATAAPTATPAA